MPIDWSIIFDHFGVKRVTATDKSRGAFVLNQDQRAALAAAGKDPAKREIFPVEVLFEPGISSLQSRYYASVRKGSGRPPEIRMGRGLIAWAKVGDEIVLGTKGARVIAAKVEAAMRVPSEVGRELANRGNKRRVLARAKKAQGKPRRKVRQVNDFVRNPYVVAAALLRADGCCEIPGCVRELFKRDDGARFLEVHHITPLGEGGDDAVANAAALCPACHRELHYGIKRLKKRGLLRAAIAAKPLP